MSPDAPYTGHFADGEHRFAIRVYYEDTDAGGIVYYANYLRFLERARTDFLALLGIDLAASQRAGDGLYVVAEVTIRYRAPARLGDALLVASRLQQINGSSLVVQQGVSCDGAEVAVATVRVVFVGADGRPRRQPASWVSAFRAITGE
jgi:acyl-CoA thioester hydrolase